MKKELFENIDWKAYQKDLEQAISNEHLWALAAGEDGILHEENIEIFKEELENIIEGNCHLVVEKHERISGEESALDYFKDFMIEDPEKVLLQAESQRNELFLDALTDIALHTGWEHVEFEDSKARSITLRSWANEFADKYADADWEKLDYITTVDDFAAKKVQAFLDEQRPSVKNESANERITDINIFTGKDNRTFIRCKIDGEQQMAKQLKFADVVQFNDNTDRQELAARYFKDALEPGQAREQGIKR